MSSPTPKSQRNILHRITSFCRTERAKIYRYIYFQSTQGKSLCQIKPMHHNSNNNNRNNTALLSTDDDIHTYCYSLCSISIVCLPPQSALCWRKFYFILNPSEKYALNEIECNIAKAGCSKNHNTSHIMCDTFYSGGIRARGGMFSWCEVK